MPGITTGPRLDRSTGWPRARTLLGKIYIQVLIGLIAGIVMGLLFPSAAAEMKPLGTAFVALIKMLVGPIVFCTVVLGICSAESMRSVGRIGLKALIYFEVISTIALLIGVVVGEVVQPGNGMHVDPSSLSDSSIAKYEQQPIEGGIVGFLTHIIPSSPVSAFADGDILQILFFSLLFGAALFSLGAKYRSVVVGIDKVSDVFFRILSYVMHLAPIGAFGAIAFTVGAYGVGTLKQLGLLMIAFYLTCIVFLVVVVGGVAALCGVNLWRLIRYFQEEILVTFGTESTEAVLPQSMAKLEHIGCAKSVTSLTFPAGYSFNLDGASIYLTLSVLFIAQATDTHLSTTQLITILAVAFVTSKGGAGVSGAVIFVLAATLQAVGTLPVAGIALLIGIDRFMNELRAVTNLIGNLVATVAVCRWENKLDRQRIDDALHGRVEALDTDDLEERLAGVEGQASDKSLDRV